jgi:signal transduction histidine kinase
MEHTVSAAQQSTGVVQPGGVMEGDGQRRSDQSDQDRRWSPAWLLHGGSGTGPSLALALLIGACFVAAVVVDYLAPWPYVMTPLYGIPVLIAAQRLSPWPVGIVGLAVVLVNVGSGILQETPLEIVALYSFGLVLTAYLAFLLALQRQTATRHALRAEAAQQRIQASMSIISHELRNPLTALRAYAQLLRRDSHQQSSRLENRAQLIEQATQRLHRLVDDLLDASRIGAGHFQISARPVDICALARDVVELQQATTDHHRLVLTAPQHLEGTWDPDRLSQFLANLISNAIKYSPDGGEVRVRIDETDGDVRVSVGDQGPGIAAEQAPLLFQPFSRLEGTQRVGGLGVGLAITKGIVEAHGGRIWVESQVGQGSTFVVVLPRQVALS